MKKLVKTVLLTLFSSLNLAAAQIPFSASSFEEDFKTVLTDRCHSSKSYRGRSRCLDVVNESEYQYNPIHLTFYANVLTTRFSFNQRRFKRVHLSFPNSAYSNNKFFRDDLVGYLRSTGSDKLLIVFSSTYSSYKGTSGSWYPQAIHHIDRIYDDPNVLIIPGMLSKEILTKSRPILPSLTGKETAKDIYERLLGLARDMNIKSMGLVGYSGGATIALNINHIDSTRERLFSLGAVYFSPIVDFLSTFETLDNSARFYHRIGAIDIEDNFFSLRSLAWLNLNGFNSPMGMARLMSGSISTSNTKWIEGAFFNSFITDDISNTINWHENISFEDCLSSSKCGNNMDFFSNYLFSKFAERGYVDSNCLNSNGPFSCYSQLVNMVGETSSSGTLVFASDDPVHNSLLETKPVSANTRNFINAAQSNSNITMVELQQGGHMGFLGFPGFVEYIFDSQFRK